MSAEIDEIFDTLEYISSTGGSVDLISTDIEHSFFSKSIIKKILRRSKQVQITVMAREPIPFFPSEQVVMYCALFPRQVWANVIKVDHRHHKVTVGKLSYCLGTQSIWKQRRVQPARTIKATIIRRAGDHQEAEVSAISSLNISLIIEGHSAPAKNLIKPREYVNLMYKCPPDGSAAGASFTLPSRVIRINRLKSGNRYRVEMRLYPDDRQSAVLRRYVYDRMTAIDHTE